MVLSSTTEQHTQTSEIETAIHNAAEARGILLDPDRAEHLVETAEYRQMLENHYSMITHFDDPFNHVTVQPAVFSEKYGATAAQLDFTPVFEEDEEEDFIVSGDTIARPEYATQFTLMAMHGLQNYVLLVDAGVIKKPGILYGMTNPQMAIVAERLGILSDSARRHAGDPGLAHKEMRQMKKMEIFGSFDEVSERLFSPDTQKLEQLLTRRLSAQKRAGTVVISAYAP